MSKKRVDIKKLSKQIIDKVSKLDIDEKYKVEVFGALLTQHLLGEELHVEKHQKAKRDEGHKPLSLSYRILALREKGFFRQSKTDLETYSVIAKEYPCTRTRVSVALLRLTKRRELRRTEKTENGRKVLAYAW